MKYKNFFTLVFLLLSFSLGLFLFDLFSQYDFKISLTAQNVSPSDIDLIFAYHINNQILKLPYVESVIMFSKEGKLSAYVKFKMFEKIFKKQITQHKIIEKIENLKSEFPSDIDINYIDNLNLKYSSFYILSTSKTYEILDKYSNLIFSNLHHIKDLNDFSKIFSIPIASYIYYTPDILKFYNIDISAIKEIVQKNNILSNFSYSQNVNSLENYLINSKIDSLEDVKNLSFKPDNSDNIVFFNDIFEFENNLLLPIEYKIDFDNKKAQVFAISKKWYCPQFILDIQFLYLSKKLSKKLPPYLFLDYQKIKFKKRLEFFMPDSSSLSALLDLKEQIIDKIGNKNVIYFLGCTPQRNRFSDRFFEDDKRKMTIFISYFDYFKNKKFFDDYKNKFPCKNRFKSFKNSFVDYKINSYFQNDYSLENEEILSSINSNYNGQILDYYYNSHSKTPIVLKRKQYKGDIFVYSKPLKSLFPLGSCCEISVKRDYSLIVRKNGEIIEKY